jgi:hypothetical protein
MCVIDQDQLELTRLQQRAEVEVDPVKRARLERAVERVSLRRERKQHRHRLDLIRKGWRDHGGQLCPPSCNLSLSTPNT